MAWHVLPRMDTSNILANHAEVAEVQTKVSDWGWLPALSVFAACGLLFIALADAASLRASSLAEPLFYAGLLIVLMPIAARLIAIQPSRRERIGLVVVLGMVLYLVKVLHSPFGFTFADEFVHWHNVNQILQTHRLFEWNTILPVTPYYPGLEELTSALASLSGLSVFYAGLLVIGVARLIMFLSLFLLVELVSRSARVAGVASLLFMCYPFFLFFSAQFSYESLSLPLVLAILFIVARREQAANPATKTPFTLLGLLVISATVVTHHLSVYFLAAFLVLWTVVARWHWSDYLTRLVMWSQTSLTRFRAWLVKRHIWKAWLTRAVRWMPQWISTWREADDPGDPSVNHGPVDLSAFTIVVAVLWLLLVANLTIGYLRPVILSAVVSVLRLIAREQTSRTLFVTASGHVPPLWERVDEIGSVVLIGLVTPFSLVQAFRQRRSHPLVLTLAILAMAYFILLGFRLTPASWETAARGTSYAFIGLSFILALGFVHVLVPQRVTTPGRILFSVYVAVVFVGGFLSGWQPNIRLAQPYKIVIQNQTFIPQSYAVAEWTRAVLGPGNGFASDFANGGPLLAIGGQKVAAVNDPTANNLVQIVEFGPEQVNIIREQHIRYILMDRRVISRDGMAGRYFDRTAGQAVPTVAILKPALVEKYDQVPMVNRILDSGYIVIYDMEAYIHAPPSS